jgi:hypothetical protein
MSATAPIVVRVKTCSSCGSTFGCCAGQCWCDDVTLDAAMLTTLRQRYADCLCPACLRAFAKSANSVE